VELDQAGLCGHCAVCRLVVTDRSVFYLCSRAASDPSYRRYPVLPVTRCAGHVEGRPERRPDGKLDP